MDTNMKAPAEVFPPGDFIREELEARNWTQADLAEIMDRPTETINRLIVGKLAVTPETARGLAAAFGTSAELWLNLESAYQLSQTNSDEAVARRARLFSIAPIKDMVKRRWIESSSNVDVIERQVIKLYELDSIDDEPQMVAAARKATGYDSNNQAQVAWYFFSKHLAASLVVSNYTRAKLEKTISKLRELTIHPNEVRHVPGLLAAAGVRFLIVKHLPQSKIDGAAFWLSRNEPVVVLSIRYDRIDWFWHTLLHELAHILNGDALSVDLELVGKETTGNDDRPEQEKVADQFACTTLIAKEELDDFITRVRPLYSKKRIVGFANRINVHPGIVVGQLQHRKEISYSHSREMLAKIRDIVTGVTITDGWGQETGNQEE